MTGQAISHYKVISELGRGGMGVVYKAEDTKLSRVVALKVLSPHMMGSEDDRARFYREARAAAALHHPNIATVFEIDEHDDAPFIAMEFIDGPSLDEYIARGPLPLEEVIDIAAQVAGALGAAHAKGIVHRDVKSANIKLTNDGVAKVLDFGLAKTSASTKLTQMGSTVGTVAYMSPEQASGHEVDQRSDVWSLGAVIYEMIAGKMPFPGAYEQAVVYNILNTDPPSLTTIRTGVPMALERIVAKCLSKDVERRYQSTVEIPVDLRVVDLKNEVTASGLSAVLSTPLVVDPAAPAEPDTASAESKAARVARPTTTSTRYFWAAAGLLLGVVATALILSTMRGNTGAADAQSQATKRLSLILPGSVPLSPVANAPLGMGRRAFALSRDGQRLAYLTIQNGVSHLAIRSLDDDEVTVLDGTEGAFLPFFSPDGNWVGFLVENVVKRVAWTGGQPLVIAEIPGSVLSATWFGDQIVAGDVETGEIRIIDVNVGTSQTITRPGRRVHIDVLPGDQQLLVSGPGPTEISIISLANPQEEKPLGQRGWAARYLKSGHIVYALRGRLMIAPFDIDHLEFTSQATPFIDNVRTEAISIAAQYAVSDDGTLVFVPGQPTDLGSLVRLDANGNAEDLGFGPEIFGSMQLSPDGRQLAIVINDPGEEIYVYDLERKTRTRLASDGRNQAPVWTKDGRNIVYVSRRDGQDDPQSIFVESAGGGNRRLIYQSDVRMGPSSLSPDGRILVTSFDQDIGFVDVQSGEHIDTLRFRDGPSLQWGGQFSPDARYVAYTSRESGRSEVYVRSFPPDGRKWQISTEGGEEPIWAESGRTLFFSNGRTWYAVPVAIGPSFSFDRPRAMFEGPYLNVPGMGYDVLPGDDSFILVRELEQPELVTQLRVIQNAVLP